ncbi:RHS domain-containing protein [Streptomyces humi]|uniref:RHS domain-containing protein n=1 Tax=Streptomyces humi TaxID=1428620 RepID=UPI00142E7143|nr:RHS domain-containing protein [Streptomyces humi]
MTPLTRSERRRSDGLSQDEVDRRFYAIVTDVVGIPTELVESSGETAWQAQATLWGSTRTEAAAGTGTP